MFDLSGIYNGHISKMKGANIKFAREMIEISFSGRFLEAPQVTDFGKEASFHIV
jgi:hypothetical protein